MRVTLLFPALVTLASASLLQAQQDSAKTQLEIRTVLHNPGKPLPSLFVSNPAGKIEKLQLLPSGISPKQLVIVLNGSLVLHDKAAVDPNNPQASVAASVKVPQNMKQAIAIILPSEAGKKPAFRVVLQDDSSTGFPKGESRILSLVPLESAIQAGEHKVSVPSGKITAVPSVKKVNSFNMAQTNFYYKQEASWQLFTERQVQYLDDIRRIYIIHVVPGSNAPSLATFVDTAVGPAVPAGKPPI
jgi:hypothetical protein